MLRLFGIESGKLWEFTETSMRFQYIGGYFTACPLEIKLSTQIPAISLPTEEHPHLACGSKLYLHQYFLSVWDLTAFFTNIQTQYSVFKHHSQYWTQIFKCKYRCMKANSLTLKSVNNTRAHDMLPCLFVQTEAPVSAVSCAWDLVRDARLEPQTPLIRICLSQASRAGGNVKVWVLPFNIPWSPAPSCFEGRSSVFYSTNGTHSGQS